MKKKTFFIEAGKIAGSFVLSVSLLAIASMFVPVRLVGYVADVVIGMIDDCIRKFGCEYIREKMINALEK